MKWTRLLLLTTLLVTMLIPACSAHKGNSGPVEFSTDIDSAMWVTIPAGEFLEGQHEHETMIDYEYETMVVDVTNNQFSEYLNEALTKGSVKIADDPEMRAVIMGTYPGDEFKGARHEEEITAGDYLHVPLFDPGLRLVQDEGDAPGFTPKPGYENHPVVLVTWFGAKAFCEHYGWRLPSELEWEKAARGEDARPYPWGEGIAKNQANYYSSEDIFEKLTGKGGDTTPVGFYNGDLYAAGTADEYQTADGASPYGLYDMAGNVWQWTGDVYPGQHYRYLRGGSKDNYEYNLRVWTRNSASPDYFSPSVGFRCVRDE